MINRSLKSCNFTKEHQSFELQKIAFSVKPLQRGTRIIASKQLLSFSYEKDAHIILTRKENRREGSSLCSYSNNRE